MRTWMVIWLAAVLLLSGTTATSAATGGRRAAAALKKETAAVGKCVTALVKSAKSLAGKKAFDEARAELRTAMAVSPLDPRPAAQYAKIRTKNSATPENVGERVAKIRATARAACAKALVPALEAWEKADCPEEFAHLATTAVLCIGEGGELEQLDLGWYESYLIWARKADIARWEKGEEFLDGSWLDAAAVEKRNAAHTEWSSPWKLGDGIQEVRTVMPIRNAKRVLNYVRSFRRFVIYYFAGEWEWKAPRGLLPIYLTETQADYQARLREFDPASASSKASALYVQRTGGLCPVFLTFEPKVAGAGVKIGWDSLLRDVRHEVAHQLLYESSMAKGASVGGNIDWVSEGIATYLGSHQPRKGRWELARPAREPYANGFEPGPFAWVKGNFKTVEKLDRFFGSFKQNLEQVEEYWVATTLTYFLLEGVGRKYRAPMIQLLIDVHMAKGNAKSFSKCFGRVDFEKMQAEWGEFVKALEIEND